MEAALRAGAADDAIAVLRDTTPFGDASDALLARIAALARPARYEAGARIYGADEVADDIFVVVSGRADHVFKPEVGAREPLKRVMRGGVFGWAGLLLGQTQRLASVAAAEPTEVLRIDTESLVKLLESEPLEGPRIMERFATTIQREFAAPALLAQVRRLSGPLTEEMSSLSLTMYRFSLWLRSPRPYLMLIGFALFLGFWYLAVEVWKLPRFREMPGVTAVVKEWFAKSPTYGLSLYTEEYYKHIVVSIWRVTQAFFLATILGVTFGLLLGCVTSRMATDALASRLLRGRAFRPRVLLAGGVKDILSGAAWAYGLVSRSIEWRSNRLVVLSGSRLRIKQPGAGWVKALVARAGAAR